MMAKVQEQIIVIKVSKLIKNDGTESDLISDDVVSSLEEVVSQLVGDGIIVEAEKA
jgi:hypothetical protein